VTSCGGSSKYHTTTATTSRRPEISDADYDALLRDLRDLLEDTYPELAASTIADPHGWGHHPRRSSAPVRHRLPMMSLDNAFSFEELVGVGQAHGAHHQRRR